MNTRDRYYAPGLQQAMRLQGRNMRWLAAQVRVHEALLSHACSCRRTISGDIARQISTLIGVPFSVLFESPHDDISTTERMMKESAA